MYGHGWTRGQSNLNSRCLVVDDEKKNKTQTFTYYCLLQPDRQTSGPTKLYTRYKLSQGIFTHKKIAFYLR